MPPVMLNLFQGPDLTWLFLL